MRKAYRRVIWVLLALSSETRYSRRVRLVGPVDSSGPTAMPSTLSSRGFGCGCLTATWPGLPVRAVAEVEQEGFRHEHVGRVVKQRGIVGDVRGVGELHVVDPDGVAEPFDVLPFQGEQPVLLDHDELCQVEP
jgi:hypothetical protein